MVSQNDLFKRLISLLKICMGISITKKEWRVMVLVYVTVIFSMIEIDTCKYTFKMVHNYKYEKYINITLSKK